MRQKSLPNWLPWLMWLLAACFYFLNFVLRVVPSILSSEIIQALQSDHTHLVKVVSVYYLSYSAMQIPIGIIMDRFGLRLTLSFGCFCCSLSLMMIITLDNFGALMFSRLLLGFGSAFSFLGAIKIIRAWLPQQHLALLTSITNTVAMLGAMTSFAILSPIIAMSDWSSVAIGLSISTLLLSILLFACVRDSKNDVHENHESFIELFQNIALVIRRSPAMFTHIIVACCASLSTIVFADLWSKIYFSHGLQFSENQAAQATSVIFLGWAIGSPIFGRIADSINNYYKPLIFGMLMTTIGFFLMFSLPISSSTGLFFLCFCFGLMASSQSLVFPIACQLAPISLTATAIAITNAGVTAGSLVFQPVIAALLEQHGPIRFADRVPIYGIEQYQMSLHTLTVASLLGFLLLILQYRWSQRQGIGHD